MDTIKRNWFLLLAGYVAWKWYISDKAGVPITEALKRFDITTSSGLVAYWHALGNKTSWEIMEANRPFIQIPIGPATVEIDGQGVSVL